MFDALIEPGDHGVGVAFTDRLDGVSSPPFDSLNLGRGGVDDAVAVAANFDRLRRRLGVGKIVTVAQVHGVGVLEVTPDVLDGWHDGSELGVHGATGVPLTEADAMVTRLPGVALCIRAADCLPVVLADSSAGVIAAAHAGRVGLLAGVLPATVDAMRRLGAQSIHAWVGPGICGRCYEVPANMAADAWAQLPATKAQTTWGTPSIDLPAGAVVQLQDAGVAVTDLGHCTFETPTLYSHRRDKGATGRQAGLVWRTDPSSAIVDLFGCLPKPAHTTSDEQSQHAVASALLDDDDRIRAGR